MRLYNGSFYIIATRQFIDWVMTNQVAQDLINWSRDTWAPEEIIWSTLYRYSGAPESEPDDGRPIGAGDSADGALARAIKWEWRTKLKNPPYPKCFQGKTVHGICVYAIADFDWLLKQEHFFAKKFRSGFQNSISRSRSLIGWKLKQ